MTDDLSPEQEAEVARLLRESADPAPLPPEVAARLDDVLAGLVAERTESSLPQSLAEVVPLRRRTLPKVLVAAAAVAVLGFAGQSMMHTGSSSQDDSAKSMPEAAAGQGDVASDQVDPQSEDAPGTEPLPSAAVRGQKRDFAANSANGLDSLLENGDELRATLAKRYLDRIPTKAPAAGCAVPEGVDPQSTTTARVGNRRVVVAVVPDAGSSARADVYPCRGLAFPLASRLLLAAR